MTSDPMPFDRFDGFGGFEGFRKWFGDDDWFKPRPQPKSS